MAEGASAEGPPDRPRKRSVTIRGHRTSVSLEDAFWRALREIAHERGGSLDGLVAEIDAAREPGATLASTIRLFVLARHRAPTPTRGG